MTKTTNFSDTKSDSAGDYLWSNVANWSNGKPTNGDSVDVLQSTSVDDIDIPNLSLAALSSTVRGAPNLNFESSIIVSANLYVAQAGLSATEVTVQAGSA
jgi:hypothetical protein